jgi:hypothetical protein
VAVDPNEQLKAELHQLRGEIVWDASHVEWIIYSLSRLFADSTQIETKRQWDDIKADLRVRKLTDQLQPQLAAVASYFDVRKRAVHGAIAISMVGDATQLFRFVPGRQLSSDTVTIEKLQSERDIVQAGRAAVQAVGRALDTDRPIVLREGMGDMGRLLIIGGD